MKIDEIAEDLREDYKNLQFFKGAYGCEDIAYFAETMGFIERISKAEAENQRLRMALRPVSDAEINLHNPGCPEVFFANRIFAERRKA